MPFIVEDVLSKLSNEQKIGLLTGLDWWHTIPINELGVPSIRMSDGPTGIRGTKFFQSIPAAALPCGIGLAATWDRKLLGEAGSLLGKEAIAKGAHCWLGPTVNITRSPLGGRNAESYGEDPHLVGALASAIIRGCQSTGVQATIKHFVCNDQEDHKASLSAVVTERALREVYLRPFQIAARDVSPSALMTAYNKVNGVHCSEQPLLEEVVRGEWKWDPLIMSDWFGTYHGHTTIKAGLDLEMPGKTMFRGEALAIALANHDIKQSILNQRARRVLQFVHKASQIEVSPMEEWRDLPEDRMLNRNLSASSIVLLKNSSNVLPLAPEVKKIALIGSHVQDLSVLGLGSTTIEPYYTISPFDAIKSKLGQDVECKYEIGVFTHQMLPLLNDRLLRNSTITFFNDPPTREHRRVVSTTPLKRTYFNLLDHNHPNLNSKLFYASVDAEFVPDTSGPWDFGVCCYGSANLYIDGEIIVDNSTEQIPGNSFFSEGTEEKRSSKELVAGQIYSLRVDFGSAATSKLTRAGIAFAGGGCRLGACPRIHVEEGIKRAERAAADSDYAIVCTGLSGEWEGEGNDRKNMSLPPHVDELISRVNSACPKTVVVNFSGSPVSMPWAAEVPAILQVWYGGNEAGNGIADVLFGDFNPCGKLPFSWPHSANDDPTYLNFGNVRGRCLYGEDVYVGYRYHDKVGRSLLWNFGHGLSYTTFQLSSLAIQSESDSEDVKTYPRTFATLNVMNTGSVAGAEVVQLYIAAPESSMARPVKELHGFEKVFLEPGQEEEITISVDPYAMSYWDEAEDSWCIEQGKYQVIVATTSKVVVGDEASRLKACLQVPRTRRWLGL